MSFGSWVGGHFKTFSQIAPLILSGGVQRKKFHQCLVSGCTIFKLVYRRPMQLSLEEYVRLLQESIDEFLLSAMYSCSLMFEKYKMHLLLLLPDHAHRYESLPVVSTEVEESMNSIFRSLYISGCGRRDTESNYMANEMSFKDDYQHFLHGGFIPDPITGFLMSRNQTSHDAVADAQFLETGRNKDIVLPVIGDYVYCLSQIRGWHGRVCEIMSRTAKISVYRIQRDPSG